MAERERNGPFRSLGDLAARIGAGRRTLEQLAWSGACDGLLGGGRDRARTGPAPLADARRGGQAIGPVAAGRGRPGPGGEGTQLALGDGAAAGAAPALARALAAADRRLRHERGDGGRPRDGGPARAARGSRLLATSAQLARLPTGCAVSVAGLVIARQRPGTAKGTMFLLFEDELGTINLIVAKGGV